MAYKRETVAKILKGKDGKADYIKVERDVTLKKGDFLNLESKSASLAGITGAESNGKLSSELADKARERVEKNFPDFVRFEVVKVTKTDS